MVDTFIANASADECVDILTSASFLWHFFPSLRSIVRNLLATGPPGLATAFTSAARSRLRQTNSKVHNSPYLFQRQTRDKPSAPTPSLHDLLTRARSLYGAGLGFASLGLLSAIVRATIGLRWEDDGDMADILAVIDADIGQAIQASLAWPIIYTILHSPYPLLPRVPKKKSKLVASLILRWHVKQKMIYDVLWTTVSPMWNLGEENFRLKEQLLVSNIGNFDYLESSCYLPYAIYIMCITVISRTEKRPWFI